MRLEPNAHDHPAGQGPHFLPKLPKVRLEICRGRARNMLREIEVPVYLIGTAPDSDLVLGDPCFPEAHAYIYINEQSVSMRRLGSGPEISVDGHTIQSAQLVDGDVIRTGSYEFRIHIDWPAQRDSDQSWTDSQEQDKLAEQNEEGREDVEKLLAEIRRETSLQSEDIKLYVEPSSSWVSVTESTGKTIRRSIA